MDAVAATEPSVGPAHRSRTRFIAGLLAAIIAGLIVAALITALVATQFLGFHALAVASDSMAPALNHGDLVLTRPVAISAVHQGDIVAFVEGETTPVTVVHRVAGVIDVNVNTTNSTTGAVTTETSRLLLTRGDANPTRDGQAVEPDRFRGLVFATLPSVGGVLVFATLPSVGGVLGAGIFREILLAIVVLTAVAWFAYELRALRRRRTTKG